MRRVSGARSSAGDVRYSGGLGVEVSLGGQSSMSSAGGPQKEEELRKEAPETEECAPCQQNDVGVAMDEDKEALSLVPSAVSDSADWREPKFMYDGQCREGGFRFNEVTATLVEDDEKPRRLRVKFMFQKENPEIRNIRTREAWPANGVTSPPWFNTVKTEQSSIRFLAGLWSVVGDTAGHTTGSSPNGCNHHGPGRAHPGQRLWRSWTFRSRRANSWCCPMGPDGFSSRRRWGSCALEKSTTNVKKICCAGAFDH